MRDCEIVSCREKEKKRERERDRVIEWQSGRELLKEWNRERGREKEREKDTPMYHRYNYRPPADTFLIFFLLFFDQVSQVCASLFNLSPYLIRRLSRRFTTVFARCCALLATVRERCDIAKIIWVRADRFLCNCFILRVTFCIPEKENFFTANRDLKL